MKIELCMGSSCFVRGNNEILPLITSLLREYGITEQVELVGHLCQERCASGPSLTIDGTFYDGITPDAVEDLLYRHVRRDTP